MIKIKVNSNKIIKKQEEIKKVNEKRFKILGKYEYLLTIDSSNNKKIINNLTKECVYKENKGKNMEFEINEGRREVNNKGLQNVENYQKSINTNKDLIIIKLE